jgi:hypothetical protein
MRGVDRIGASPHFLASTLDRSGRLIGRDGCITPKRLTLVNRPVERTLNARNLNSETEPGASVVSVSRKSKSRYARLVAFGFRHLSERRTIHGVSVRLVRGLPNEAIFEKLTSAFNLLQVYGGETLRDLRQHTNGVFGGAIAGARGCWERQTRMVILDDAYLRDQGTTPAKMASTLVHESTHARLEANGFGYTAETRERIEKVCIRRQLAFARRLAEPGSLMEEAQWQLEQPPEFFSVETQRARAAAARIERVPPWLIRAMNWYRSAQRGFSDLWRR